MFFANIFAERIVIMLARDAESRIAKIEYPRKEGSRVFINSITVAALPVRALLIE